MAEFNSDDVRQGTAKEFTRAINLSFEPVARLGQEAMTRLYLVHSDILPLRLEHIDDMGPPIDLVAAISLNSLHRLSSAREEYILNNYPDMPIDRVHVLPIVTTAYAEIFGFVYKAQGSLTTFRGSVYNRDLSHE